MRIAIGSSGHWGKHIRTAGWPSSLAEFGYSLVSCFVVHVTHCPLERTAGPLVLSFIKGVFVPSCAVELPWGQRSCTYAAVSIPGHYIAM